MNRKDAIQMVRRHCVSVLPAYFEATAPGLPEKDRARLRFAVDAVTADMMGENRPKPVQSAQPKPDDRQLDMFESKSGVAVPPAAAVDHLHGGDELLLDDDGTCAHCGVKP